MSWSLSASPCLRRKQEVAVIQAETQEVITNTDQVRGKVCVSLFFDSHYTIKVEFQAVRKTESHTTSNTSDNTNTNPINTLSYVMLEQSGDMLTTQSPEWKPSL